MSKFKMFAFVAVFGLALTGFANSAYAADPITCKEGFTLQVTNGNEYCYRYHAGHSTIIGAPYFYHQIPELNTTMDFDTFDRIWNIPRGQDLIRKVWTLKTFGA